MTSFPPVNRQHEDARDVADSMINLMRPEERRRVHDELNKTGIPELPHDVLEDKLLLAELKNQLLEVVRQEAKAELGQRICAMIPDLLAGNGDLQATVNQVVSKLSATEKDLLHDLVQAAEFNHPQGGLQWGMPRRRRDDADEMRTLKPLSDNGDLVAAFSKALDTQPILSRAAWMLDSVRLWWKPDPSTAPDPVKQKPSTLAATGQRLMSWLKADNGTPAANVGPLRGPKP